MNLVVFYDYIRTALFKGKMTIKQVDGIAALVTHWLTFIKPIDGDVRKLAYVLATVYHETGKAMQPVPENGKGRGRKYGKKVKHSGAAYKLPDQIYYGRGFPQLTWYENYELMGRLLNLDLLNNPDLMLDVIVSTRVLYEGMYKGASSFGDFTGKCLEMYFNAKVNNPIGARYIINGQDKAELIAAYHNTFLTAIKKAS